MENNYRANSNYNSTSVGGSADYFVDTLQSNKFCYVVRNKDNEV